MILDGKSRIFVTGFELIIACSRNFLEKTLHVLWCCVDEKRTNIYYRNTEEFGSVHQVFLWVDLTAGELSISWWAQPLAGQDHPRDASRHK